MNNETWHENRVAVVTGGTAGIGLEIARVLKRRGAKVAIGGRREPKEYDALKDEGFLIGQLDVCSTESIEVFITLVKSTYGSPNILVNSAGISVHHPVVDHSDSEWLTAIDTNLNGPFRTIRTCLPYMMSSGWGRIVNIASTAASTATDTHAAYCASKSGLLGLTRSVAIEGAPFGVTCTSVSPTWVETDMLQSSMKKMAKRSGRTPAEEKQDIESSNPQKRLVQPIEIAELTSFLCSDLSPALTMEDIQINAGALW